MLLLQLQDGDSLRMPHSRPMPRIGPRYHELRVRDEEQNWRIVYRLDTDAIVIATVFAKARTADAEACHRRLPTSSEGL